LEPIWKLITIHLPVYVQTVGYGKNLKKLPDDPELKYVKYPFIDTTAFNDDEPGIEGMTRQLIDLIGTFILNPGIHPLLKAGLGPFACTLCSYMLVPQNQLDDYKDNAFYFIEESYSNAETELGYSESIRILCTRILETLIETFGTITIETLLSFVLDDTAIAKNLELSLFFLKNPKNPCPTSNENMSEREIKHETWRKDELKLYILGLIADDLFIALEKGSTFVNVSEVEKVIVSICESPILKEKPLLLGRLLCTSTNCVQLYPKSTATLKKLIETSFTTIKNECYDSIKYIACKCLVRCSHQLKELPVVDEEEIIRRIPKPDTENIAIVTETLATLFQYGNPKSLGKYLNEIIKSYLTFSIENETGGDEVKLLVLKLLALESYTDLLTKIFIPLALPKIQDYPKNVDPGLTRVTFPFIL
jgi:hypothetical protein